MQWYRIPYGQHRNWAGAIEPFKGKRMPVNYSSTRQYLPVADNVRQKRMRGRTTPPKVRIANALSNAGIKPEKWLVRLFLKSPKLRKAARNQPLFASRSYGEISMFIRHPKGNHGHVVCLLKERALTSHRGLGEPHGKQNLCYITL